MWAPPVAALESEGRAQNWAVFPTNGDMSRVQVYPREERVHLDLGSHSNGASFGFELPPTALVVLHLQLNWHAGVGPAVVSRSIISTE